MDVFYSIWFCIGLICALIACYVETKTAHKILGTIGLIIMCITSILTVRFFKFHHDDNKVLDNQEIKITYEITNNETVIADSTIILFK